MPFTKILMICCHFPAEVIVVWIKIQNKKWAVHLTQSWQRQPIQSFILLILTNRTEKLLKKTTSHSQAQIDQNSFHHFCQSNVTQLGLTSRLDLNSNKTLSYKAALNLSHTFRTRYKIYSPPLKINLDEIIPFSI
jgi:hypothetical protein